MTPKWSEIDPKMDPKIHPKRPRIDPKSEKGRKRRNEELVDRCNGKGREEGKARTEKKVEKGADGIPAWYQPGGRGWREVKGYPRRKVPPGIWEGGRVAGSGKEWKTQNKI